MGPLVANFALQTPKFFNIKIATVTNNLNQNLHKDIYKFKIFPVE
jgi:hypothetical protein